MVAERLRFIITSAQGRQAAGDLARRTWKRARFPREDVLLGIARRPAGRPGRPTGPFHVKRLTSIRQTPEFEHASWSSCARRGDDDRPCALVMMKPDGRRKWVALGKRDTGRACRMSIEFLSPSPISPVSWSLATPTAASSVVGPEGVHRSASRTPSRSPSTSLSDAKS